MAAAQRDRPLVPSTAHALPGSARQRWPEGDRESGDKCKAHAPRPRTRGNPRPSGSFDLCAPRRKWSAHAPRSTVPGEEGGIGSTKECFCACAPRTVRGGVAEGVARQLACLASGRSGGRLPPLPKGWGLGREAWHPGGKWGDSGASSEPPREEAPSRPTRSVARNRPSAQPASRAGPCGAGGSWKRWKRRVAARGTARTPAHLAAASARQQEGPGGEGRGKMLPFVSPPHLSATVGCL